MARDNGSRGYYRHANSTERKAQEQQLPTPDKASKPSPDEDVTPKATAALEDIKLIDSPVIDHLTDHAPDLLNIRFPPMPIPGSMPRRQTNLFRRLGRQHQAYGWKDVAITTAVYGSAAFGFAVIMCDGVKAIGGYLVGVGAHLMYETMFVLGI